jgi:hypothetical protein
MNDSSTFDILRTADLFGKNLINVYFTATSSSKTSVYLTEVDPSSTQFSFR